ncbi:MAG: four helix bundle protein [Acidobacteria bacterium]|nr:four helix bundle protein [Acidobacteriota bacterium]
MENQAGHRGLKVYQLSYQLAMEIFHISRSFPKEETYSLTDQIRRSSRSVPANIAEAYRKRQYTKHFVSKLSDADGEGSETQVWIETSRDCGYLSTEKCAELIERYEEVGRMLGGMMSNPERFLPK